MQNLLFDIKCRGIKCPIVQGTGIELVNKRPAMFFEAGEWSFS